MRRAVVAVLVLVLNGGPASALDATSISIGQIAVSDGQVAIAGALALGADAEGTLQVASDPAGDDMIPTSADGLDLASGSMRADLATGQLILTIGVHDMSPQLETVAPTFVYDWQMSVDGEAAGFAQAGFATGYAFIGATTFFQHCADDFSCTPIVGTMGGGVTTLRVPFARLGAGPGSVIGTGTTLSNETISSTWSPWALFHRFGGDSATAEDMRLPGGVLLGLAEAGTPEEQIEATTPAEVATDGTFTGALELPGPGSYVVVARSCFGLVTTPTCATASASVTV